MGNGKFKEKDRVRKINSQGCYGTVKALRSEISATSQEAKEKGLMINVQWDNGTLSYVGQEVIELVTEK